MNVVSLREKVLQHFKQPVDSFDDFATDVDTDMILTETNDSIVELGKYNWFHFSRDNLKKFDVEAMSYLDKYRESCENNADDYEEMRQRDEADAAFPLCPCVPPNLRKY